MSEDHVGSMLGSMGKLKDLKDAARWLPVASAANRLKSGMPVEDYLKGVIDVVHEVAKVQGIHYRDMEAGKLLDLAYDLIQTDSRVRELVVGLLKPLVK